MGEFKDYKQFDIDMDASQELVEQYNEILHRIAVDETAESDADAVIKAAKELGYTITAADLERAMARNEKMDLEELESVSGGSDLCWKDYSCVVAYHTSTVDNDDHDFWCVADYHCITAYHHNTPTGGYEGEDNNNNRQTVCWSDYSCAIINKHPCSVGATEG